MGSVSMVFYLLIFTYVFFRWQRLEEKKQSMDARPM
jgi:hypothetical protein